MSNNQNGSHKLLLELAKTVEVFGDERTTDILYQERTKVKNVKDISFIVQLVCERFKITKEQVIGSKDNKNIKRLYAMQFICYYAYESFEDVNFDDISIILKRDISLPGKHHVALSKKRKDKNDHTLQDHFKYFDQNIKKYISGKVPAGKK